MQACIALIDASVVTSTAPSPRDVRATFGGDPPNNKPSIRDSLPTIATDAHLAVMMV